MTTYIQINSIGYDHIEDQKELEAIQEMAGPETGRNFVFIIDGDESLIRKTSVLEGDQIWTPEELPSLEEGDTVIVAEDEKDIIEKLAKIAQRRPSVWAGEATFQIS